MQNNTDFAAVVDHELRKRPERGDEASAHISDLYGCDLATWARRRGEPQLPFSPQTLVKFQMGRDVEDAIAKGITMSYPGDSERDTEVAWALEGGVMVGHIDIDLPGEDAIIEVKSTVFYGKTPPENPSEHYIEQAAGYAVALGRKRFAIVVVCRSTGNIRTWWYDTADYALETRARALEVLEATDPTVPFAPAANPRQKWACSYCNYGACPKNTNAAKAMVANA